MAAFARDWKAARQQEQKTCGRGVFVPLAFLPGEAFQFDSVPPPSSKRFASPLVLL